MSFSGNVGRKGLPGIVVPPKLDELPTGSPGPQGDTGPTGYTGTRGRPGFPGRQGKLHKQIS